MWQPISPLVGEMSGRTEGGVPPALQQTAIVPPKLILLQNEAGALRRPLCPGPLAKNLASPPQGGIGGVGDGANFSTLRDPYHALESPGRDLSAEAK
ncbi:MAG: hypothetical protein EOR48_30835 [Mesorhizobium sp.]|nr:MAG: hypothetical protein EOR48_30835 [Mesorhizobium sp.]TIP41417.1 MAG: hypothetical protein E5X62_25165 [Mesorhizobium sp.]